MASIDENTQSQIIALNGVAETLVEMLDWCDAAGDHGTSVSVPKRKLQGILHDVDATRLAMALGAKVEL